MAGKTAVCSRNTQAAMLLPNCIWWLGFFILKHLFTITKWKKLPQSGKSGGVQSDNIRCQEVKEQYKKLCKCEFKTPVLNKSAKF